MEINMIKDWQQLSKLIGDKKISVNEAIETLNKGSKNE